MVGDENQSVINLTNYLFGENHFAIDYWHRRKKIPDDLNDIITELGLQRKKKSRYADL